MFRTVLSATACAWLLGAAGPAAAQVAAYNSGGFEGPRFGAGDLAGQDTVLGPWQRFGAGTASTAVVQTAVTNGGPQAIRMDRAANDNSWWGVQQAVPTPLMRVTIAWDMRVAQAPNNGQAFGPFFGVDAFSSAGRLGMLGVDAFTGDLLYIDPVNALQPTTPATVVSFDVFHSYRMELDFNVSGGGTYRVFVDGIQVPISNPTTGAAGFFTNGGNTLFTRALITGLPAGPDAAAQAATGTAFFDNYMITVTPVPEPASLALAGVGMAALAYRGRRRTARG